MQKQLDEVQHCHQSSEEREDTCWRLAVAFGCVAHVSLTQGVEGWQNSSDCVEFFICFQRRRRFGVVCSSAAESALQSAPSNYFESLKSLSQLSCAELRLLDGEDSKGEKLPSDFSQYDLTNQLPVDEHNVFAASSHPVGSKPKLGHLLKSQ